MSSQKGRAQVYFHTLVFSFALVKLAAMNADDLVVYPTHLLWRGQRFPRSIGKGGITSDKREGDGATPRGMHRIIGMLYRPDRIMKPAKWAKPIRPGDLWSDDPEDSLYNQRVRAPYPHSHEALRRGDRLYDLVLLTDWNWPDVAKGQGSAIFVHRWRKPGHPTEGCIGLHPAHLAKIAKTILPGTRLILN